MTRRKNAAILTVVDRFSKIAHFIALQRATEAPVLAEAVLGNVIRLHGFPKTVVSDRDPRFMGRFW